MFLWIEEILGYMFEVTFRQTGPEWNTITTFTLGVYTMPDDLWTYKILKQYVYEKSFYKKETYGEILSSLIKEDIRKFLIKEEEKINGK